MRKLRGLTKDGKWVYGWYVKCRGEHYILPLHNPDDPESSFDERWIQEGADEDGWFEVIPETVSQATGKENVYEGDKIKSKLFDGIVKWLDYSFRVIDENGFPHQLYNATEIKIIGNIFDNDSK